MDCGDGRDTQRALRKFKVEMVAAIDEALASGANDTEVDLTMLMSFSDGVVVMATTIDSSVELGTVLGKSHERVESGAWAKSRMTHRVFVAGESEEAPATEGEEV